MLTVGYEIPVALVRYTMLTVSHERPVALIRYLVIEAIYLSMRTATNIKYSFSNTAVIIGTILRNEVRFYYG